MLEILPSINHHVGDFERVAADIARVRNFAKMVHLDVADGKFTFNKSWGDPKKWKTMENAPELEVHLMVERPEKVIGEWLEAGAKRVIVHYESIAGFSSPYQGEVRRGSPDTLFTELIRQCEDAGSELVLSSNPETSVEQMKPYLNLFSSFQVLSVYPGPSGQPFLPLTLQKVSWLRDTFPASRIEVDGGMNPETARLAKEAGANAFVVGAYLFEGEDTLKRYHEILEAIS